MEQIHEIDYAFSAISKALMLIPLDSTQRVEVEKLVQNCYKIGKIKGEINVLECLFVSANDQNSRHHYRGYSNSNYNELNSLIEKILI